MTKGEDITTPIVPSTTRYYELPGEPELDYEAICCFAATGFFLDDDTYFRNKKAYRPGSIYRFDGQGNLIKNERHFRWHYSPRDISFGQALDEFSHTIETIVQRDTAGKKVILPISGGLDSRTLAATLSGKENVFAYSYEFENGPSENYFGEEVARSSSFGYQGFTIRPGYLWKIIETLASINECYAEFTNPRQMAIWQQLKEKGDIFLLGHGGDLFFDGMGVSDTLSFEDQVSYLVKKLIKPAGWELGDQLWKNWGCPGNFKDYLVSRIETMLKFLAIDNANTQLRAFKTENYVARWTAVNLEIFQRQKPLSIPFFDDAMCRFICSVPEEHLAGRKLEIEYVKKKSRALASIPWQKYFPCNLYNYNEFQTMNFMIQRAWIKGRREAMRFLSGKKFNTRNWELQFLGPSNDRALRSCLYRDSFSQFIPKSVTEKFYLKFTKHPVGDVHTVTMLLTLALFDQLFLQKGGKRG